MTPWLTVVGIGEDGFPGLGKQARRALLGATKIVGSPRQLALLPHCTRAEQLPWPSPFSLNPVLALRGEPVCVLASGDPMFYGVGASLARLVPAAEMRVLSMPSSCALAAARLGWPVQDLHVVSLVARPLAALNAHLYSGLRLLVLSNDGDSPAAIAALLCERGFGPSRVQVFEHLGGEAERTLVGTAQDWPHTDIAALNLVAIDCQATPHAPRHHRLAGLPDSAFRHDGQLTKRDVRAMTLARLAPQPGELLWDVGAGCGSIGIEWMRAHPACRALAIEADEGRQGFIEHNRDALGVPGLQLVRGKAPAALHGLEPPDAIFIGGGVTREGVLDLCWASLRPGGRLVANAVTLQSELALAHFRQQHGGELTRVHVAHAQPLGAFDTWRQALPITLLEVQKPVDA
ncbi:bifunctional cobalt-precorrin-7 (C(5))-methyltransferase/cobalt-precorrin-6B (C(15))-methyltransferase [Pseudomonas juntendi]|jgi:precorrin-6Y C5,15-methyltransferase (decarboxylating)|uniref:Bifunctional cobalt-precorrin-7 (C(5))-methyltransferase/cobalt-precorrin-6B (C(15))-methyltransferase n=1 Tax=Pseudomonas juntendi TaxID=2666183 RepID=A0ABD4Y8E3_9PSED|nr:MULTISPECIES: bifunctional cobalt-precorrin-7 (C(5))-methyltransferase/cobalt-precorrin-6B (C(15))-methyltransferase [Pseudomonas]EGB98855.1 precorrin-6Y C5,15-methyltransferase [Pseudomonas sp. TJI-51]MBA6121274.1 bifunctional cobalt-precorrin-7 (C(5))-methyltransferase/cobalt-precorrin-6B (C(15))-methyltransferase [Pseudomonas juntendi]MBI6915077.1 bifunctional cobalt-precorrin-7 (C(5))-methyltransferase/cobalt-precorrin-6B (C(15))-methyltransferase [Pseudomonas juntendi]MBS6038723.1 bifun